MHENREYSAEVFGIDPTDTLYVLKYKYARACQTRVWLHTPYAAVELTIISSTCEKFWINKNIPSQDRLPAGWRQISRHSRMQPAIPTPSPSTQPPSPPPPSAWNGSWQFSILNTLVLRKLLTVTRQTFQAGVKLTTETRVWQTPHRVSAQQGQYYSSDTNESKRWEDSSLHQSLNSPLPHQSLNRKKFWD